MSDLDRFEKHHPNHRRGIHGKEMSEFGVSAINTSGILDKLSNVFESNSDLEWAYHQSTSEGPVHQRLRNTIILNQLAELIDKVKANAKNTTTVLKGTNPKEYGFTYPLGIPTEVLKYIDKKNPEETMEWISEGPYHEVAVDALIMNCLASLSKTIDELK